MGANKFLMPLALVVLIGGAGTGLRAQPALPPVAHAPGSPTPVADAPGPPPPLRLADAIRRSLANVETVQANVAVQTATVARFDALKQFLPLITLPQIMVNLRNYDTRPGSIAFFPDVTDGIPWAGIPGDHGMINRVAMFLPIDPSGQITALPIAEEGIHAKVLMEQLVRRSQAILAIQDYFEAKQIQYGIRTAQLALNLADETLALTERKLVQKQVHEVEVSQARVDAGRARVLLADLEKASRIRQRALAVVLHQSRLLVPQTEPVPIVLDHDYCFDLNDPDLVDLGVVPDFPTCREEAVELAKRNRVEVRILVVGLRIAELRRKGSLLGLFGKGQVPGELAFKNSTLPEGGAAMGAIFGSTWNAPLLDVGLWSSIRKARLDVVQSQLDLEKSLLDVAADAGDSWDRWQQAIQEWEQREKELALRREYMERQQRLYQQKQSIWVEVLGTQVGFLQADANRWTAWYNLQLARLDVLRATELLLDYVEKAKIADLTAWQKPPRDDKWWHRWLPWLASKQSTQPSASEENHGRP